MAQAGNPGANSKDHPGILAVVTKIRTVYRSWSRSTSFAQMRRDWDGLFQCDLPRAALEPVVLNGVNCAWISAPNAIQSGKVLMYFHGGGFQMGSLVSHRGLMANLSAVSGCRVLGVDYRLAPEYHFPAPVDDALAAFDALLPMGIPVSCIALAGDSAGGGLALSLLLRLRDAGRPLPVAAALMSPWTDMTASGASYETRAAADPIHQRATILALACNYLGVKSNAGDPDNLMRNPLASPLFAQLRGLPPLLIQVGDREAVLSDSTELAAKAAAAGVAVTLEVWDGMIHVFQQYPDALPEAKIALQAMGAFLETHLKGAAP